MLFRLAFWLVIIEYIQGFKKRKQGYQKKWYKLNKKRHNMIGEQWYNDNPEWAKQYYINNKEKILEQSNQWRKDNPEKTKEIKEREYQNNKENYNKRSKQYAINNPEKTKEIKKKYAKTEKGRASDQRAKTKRRAIEKNIINTLTAKEWADTLEEHNYRCVYCGVEFNCELLPTKDHVIPIIKGGNNTKENIVPACQSCNSKKGKLQYQF